jgi:hypothetical protein
VLLCAWSIGFIVCSAALARVSRNLSVTAEQTPVQTRPPGKVRNLALQPEAFRLSRLLGKRFTPSLESATYIVATLTTAGVEQSVSNTRRQTSTGEDVAIASTDGAGTLNWNEADGATAIGANLDKAQQLLIERVALDNPDQFVLAQLRGASYYTVAHNVRADAGGAENYSGPLWNVVRVDEPQTESTRRALSNYRLYYINVQTGLIDKIVSELEGETIEAAILAWSDQLGDRFPSHIVWKRGNETVQEYRLISVSLQSQL